MKAAFLQKQEGSGLVCRRSAAFLKRSHQQHQHQHQRGQQRRRRLVVQSRASRESANTRLPRLSAEEAKASSGARKTNERSGKNRKEGNVFVESVRRNPTKFLLLPAGIASTTLLSTSFSSLVSIFEGSASTLQTALALGLVVTVHECGHFAAARLQNIHVSKFSVGFGPSVLRYQGSKVEYSLRLFPFGGFVAFPEEKGDLEPDEVREYSEDDPNLLNNRPIKDRFLVISAGVVANMIMAFGILWGQSLNPGLMQVTYYPGVKVPELESTSVAKKSGLRAGDTITGINGVLVGVGEEAVDNIVSTIKKSPGKDVTLDLKRENRTMTLTVQPEEVSDGTGRIGIQLVSNTERRQVKAFNILDGAGMATKETWKLTKLVLNGFGNLLFNFGQNFDKLSGPVAIIANGAEYTRNNLYDLLQFMVIVNINLAVINTVPLPGLDGGYLALLFAETIRGGKKLPENVENIINQSGFALLFFLGITLLIKDSVKLIQ